MKYDDTLIRLRKEIFLAAYSGGIGHLASAYSCLEILYALYCNNILKYDPLNTEWDDRDYFVLSKGHGSLALYAVMSECGFFDKDEIYTFSQDGTRLGGEPNKLELPGVEVSTGSLGHGLSVAVGIAIGLKKSNVTNKVYAIVGDGESEEGSIWEAVMSASAFDLDNLTVILDYNHIQKMDKVDSIMKIESWGVIWKSFGWDVVQVDGHDIEKLTDVLKNQYTTGKPRLIIADTVKGKGVSIMENDPGWHWRLPTKKEMKIVKEELHISDEELEKCKRHI